MHLNEVTLRGKVASDPKVSFSRPNWMGRQAKFAGFMIETEGIRIWVQTYNQHLIDNIETKKSTDFGKGKWVEITGALIKSVKTEDDGKKNWFDYITLEQIAPVTERKNQSYLNQIVIQGKIRRDLRGEEQLGLKKPPILSGVTRLGNEFASVYVVTNFPDDPSQKTQVLQLETYNPKMVAQILGTLNPGDELYIEGKIRKKYKGNFTTIDPIVIDYNKGPKVEEQEHYWDVADLYAPKPVRRQTQREIRFRSAKTYSMVDPESLEFAVRRPEPVVVKPYSQTETYLKGDVVKHPTLGTGVVIKTKEDRFYIQIANSIDVRILLHNQEKNKQPLVPRAIIPPPTLRKIYSVHQYSPQHRYTAGDKLQSWRWSGLGIVTNVLGDTITVMIPSERQSVQLPQGKANPIYNFPVRSDFLRKELIVPHVTTPQLPGIPQQQLHHWNFARAIPDKKITIEALDTKSGIQLKHDGETLGFIRKYLDQGFAAEMGSGWPQQIDVLQPWIVPFEEAMLFAHEYLSRMLKADITVKIENPTEGLTSNSNVLPFLETDHNEPLPIRKITIKRPIQDKLLEADRKYYHIVENGKKIGRIIENKDTTITLKIKDNPYVIIEKPLHDQKQRLMEAIREELRTESKAHLEINMSQPKSIRKMTSAVSTLTKNGINIEQIYYEFSNFLKDCFNDYNALFTCEQKHVKGELKGNESTGFLSPEKIDNIINQVTIAYKTEKKFLIPIMREINSMPENQTLEEQYKFLAEAINKHFNTYNSLSSESKTYAITSLAEELNLSTKKVIEIASHIEEKYQQPDQNMSNTIQLQKETHPVIERLIHALETHQRFQAPMESKISSMLTSFDIFISQNRNALLLMPDKERTEEIKNIAKNYGLPYTTMAVALRTTLKRKPLAKSVIERNNSYNRSVEQFTPALA